MCPIRRVTKASLNATNLTHCSSVEKVHGGVQGSSMRWDLADQVSHIKEQFQLPEETTAALQLLATSDRSRPLAPTWRSSVWRWRMDGTVFRVQKVCLAGALVGDEVEAETSHGQMRMALCSCRPPQCSLWQCRQQPGAQRLAPGRELCRPPARRAGSCSAQS